MVHLLESSRTTQVLHGSRMVHVGSKSAAAPVVIVMREPEVHSTGGKSCNCSLVTWGILVSRITTFMDLVFSKVR